MLVKIGMCRTVVAMVPRRARCRTTRLRHMVRNLHRLCWGKSIVRPHRARPFPVLRFGLVMNIMMCTVPPPTHFYIIMHQMLL